MDEIHSKLVDIMQDRLIVAAKQLVVEADGWAAAANAAAATAAAAAATATAAAAAAAPSPSQPHTQLPSMLEAVQSSPSEPSASTDLHVQSNQQHEQLHSHQASQPSSRPANGKDGTGTSNGSTNGTTSESTGASSSSTMPQPGEVVVGVSTQVQVPRVGSQLQLQQQPRLVFPVPFLPPAESIRLLSKQLSTLRAVLAPILQVRMPTIMLHTP